MKTRQENSVLRIVFGVIAGFFAWLLAWVGSEKILSAIWPESFGANQRAFEAALTNGGPFTADTTLLLIQLVLGSLVSVLAGYLAARIARDNKRAPLILGILLLALGLLKAILSWPYVPVWHHVLFPALLLPMTVIGGKLPAARSA
jgi:predicted acyltransferase